MKIYIFSEIKYHDNKHINQYFFDHLVKNNFDCVYIERVTMRFPKISRLMKLSFFPFLKRKKTDFEEKNSHIISCLILPPLKIFEKINKRRVNKIVGNKNDSVIVSFVPHRHLFESDYKKVVYYCVHDSSQQGFYSSTIQFEKEISKRDNSIIFCDNKDVLLTLSQNFSNYPYDKNSCKAYIMPPPVPDVFFEKQESEKIYDFCYYGSFHKDIDINVILSLSSQYRILILSNNVPSDLLNKQNIIVHKSIYDMKTLAHVVSSAKNILLPYKNSNFMDTITPAKALQVIALKMPVYCTNRKLADKYQFTFNINKINDFRVQDLDYMYSVTEICNFILNKIKD